MTAGPYVGIVIHMGPCTQSALQIRASANYAGNCTYPVLTQCCAHPTYAVAHMIACKASRAIPFMTLPGCMNA